MNTQTQTVNFQSLATTILEKLLNNDSTTFAKISNTKRVTETDNTFKSMMADFNNYLDDEIEETWLMELESELLAA